MHDEGGEVMRGSKRARLGGSAEEGFDHPKHEALAAAGEQHQNEDDDAAAVHHASLAAVVSRCPYLDTVNRRALDFDMEKACSITLARGHNIYACLVCGQFFQGRGKSTPMYTHSVQHGHFVVMNLHTGRFFCLPDGYEVPAAQTSSLADVLRCLRPTFAHEEIVRDVGRNAALARDVHGMSYLPGFVGLNNLGRTDYVSVVLHALSHVRPLRDFFLEQRELQVLPLPGGGGGGQQDVGPKNALVVKFGEVMRKMWSAHNFKSVVSPQEFLHEVSVASQKRFSVASGQQEAADFLVWLLNALHRGLGGTSKKNSSIVYKTFQGSLTVHTMTKRRSPPPSSSSSKGGEGEEVEGETKRAEGEDDEGRAGNNPGWVTSSRAVPFLYLSLDIPPTPLFKDTQGGLVIPQVPLFELLRKFTWTDSISTDHAHASAGSGAAGTGDAAGALTRKRYCLDALPQYLILHLVRFTKNNFFVEKNPSIVTFPVKNLEMKPFLSKGGTDTDESSAPAIAGEEGASGSVADLRAGVARVLGQLDEWPRRAAASLSADAQQALARETRALRARFASALERADLASITSDTVRLLETLRQGVSSKYDLVANICHDSLVSQGTDVTSETRAYAKPAPSAGGGPVNVLTQGSYRCHLENKATNQWFELQDLHVSETMPQLIGLSESYLLVYERKPQKA